MTCGSSACWREKASSRLVRVAARCAPCSAISLARVMRATAADGGRSGSWRPIMSRPPSTMVRRLLKSCATPPVSWPTASIFCAWRSDSSARLRASFSASSCPRALLDRVFQRLGEVAQLDHLALAVGDVDADADHADRLSGCVVEWQAPGVDPAQFVVVLPDDPEIELELARLVAKRRCDDVAQPHLVVAIDRRDPAVVTAVEIRQPVHRLGGWRQPHGAALARPSRSRRRGRSVRQAPAVRRFRQD